MGKPNNKQASRATHQRNRNDPVYQSPALGVVAVEAAIAAALAVEESTSLPAEDRQGHAVAEEGMVASGIQAVPT